MNIGVLTKEAIRHFGERDGLAMLAEAGFKSLDYGVNIYPTDKDIFAASDEELFDYFAELRVYIESLGMYVNQIHTHYPIYTGDAERDAHCFELQRKGLLCASAIGARYAVIHPAKLQSNIYGRASAENKALNMDIYSRLIPYADEFGVLIAVENMFDTDRESDRLCPTACSSSEELADYTDTLNSLCKNGKRFVACLDTGHAALSGERPIGEMIRILGDRLKVLHVHDNDGILDCHRAPGFGIIDWEEVCTALHDIGYSGDFSFEAYAFFREYDHEHQLEAGKRLFAIGTELISRYGLV